VSDTKDDRDLAAATLKITAAISRLADDGIDANALMTVMTCQLANLAAACLDIQTDRLGFWRDELVKSIAKSIGRVLEASRLEHERRN